LHEKVIGPIWNFFVPVITGQSVSGEIQNFTPKRMVQADRLRAAMPSLEQAGILTTELQWTCN